MKYFFKKNKIVLVVLVLCLFCLGWTIYKNKTKTEPYGNYGGNKKIAFCFLIYDTINHEELWKKFFDRVDKNKYNIYIHYKYDVPLNYFEKYKLNNCIETEWGKISLVKASNLLFKTAYDDDTENHKFVLLSDSCIPLKNFDKIYNKLTSDNYGYLNASENDIKNKNCKIYKENPKKYGKASQWIILNREMVKEIAFHDDKWIDSNFGDVFAPDEIYYYTMLKHKNMENKLIVANNSATKGSTFVYWTDMDYPYSYDGNTSPRAYDIISSEELSYLFNQPCLFGRKFNQNCKVLMNDEYKKIEDVIEY